MFFCAVLVLIHTNVLMAIDNPVNKDQKMLLLENKGQVKDQYGCARNDIQFEVRSAGINIFIGDGKLHYQFTHCFYTNDCPAGDVCNAKNGITEFYPPTATLNKITSYRMDVELVGTTGKIEAVAEQPQDYYENYFLNNDEIVAHTCKRVVYKNVYPDIDWVIYIDGEQLEHEFIVGPNGDASMIKLKYSGQTSLKINEDGSITATTPMGTIKEAAPVCYGVNGAVLSSAFKLENNILGYAIGHKGALVIDPPLEWATYYGPDTSTSSMYAIVCDNAGHVYGAGLTYAAAMGSIATTGSFQYTFGGGGTDAYLVKFDSSGHRLWATYYGGSGDDWGSAVACDRSGNIYLGGSTASTSGIATPGAQQTFYGGGLRSGFLAKFNASGARLWGTYVGGTVGANFDLEVSSVVCDWYAHVYVSGSTDDSANVGTPGTFRPYKHESFDTTVVAFLIQYDTATGVRNWGTYYGGPRRNTTFTGASCTDGLNIYLAGWTNDTTGTTIASAGSYQPAMKGPSDAFIAKFDSSGNRLWGTYYGGESQETAGGITCDVINGLYFLGSTSSNTGIASIGCSQPLRGGLDDAFLAKFDRGTGMRVWGTYYGGPGDEETVPTRIITGGDYVYIAGTTTSLTGIASVGAWQTTFGGGDQDVFFAAYDFTGKQQWSTYYGGKNHEEGMGIAYDGYGVYLCGETNSNSQIATVGGFEPVLGVDTAAYLYSGFLAKFADPRITLSVTNNKVQAALSIYPNPNNGSFSLTGKFEGVDSNVQINISDLTGRIVFNDNAVISNRVINKQISLKNLPSGLYIITAISQEQVSVLKFVKE
jgi:hypothetical protein